MRDKIQIANTAVVLLGADPIQSFEDDTTEAYAASLLYDDVYRQLLAYRAWTFAKGRRKLQKINMESEYGYDHVYMIPDELLRITNLVGNQPYGIYESKFLHTNCRDCSVDGIIVPVESNLPSDFTLALTNTLAAHLAPIITDNDAQRERFEALGVRYLNIAADNDASQLTLTYGTNSNLLRYHV